jgi:S1-C subfamily serine protease
MQTTRMSNVAIALITFIVGVGSAHAAEPRFQNARVTTSQSRDIEREVAAAIAATSAQPTWIGWSIPAIGGRGNMCCHQGNYGDQCCGACALEGTRDRTVAVEPDASSSGVVQLEGTPAVVMMVRVAEKQVERIKVFSENCVLDAGGTAVVWLPAVTPSDSLAWLQIVLRSQDSSVTTVGRERERQVGSVVMAISFHAGPQADRVLVEAARQHASTKVRREALFWLAQKASQAAVATISDAIERDPETEVKKHAVFALSQLPKDEGVPRLIDVARTHSNPAVRRQAMFWLGQSRDPRAISFFEQVLNVR